jgi:adenylate kinase
LGYDLVRKRLILLGAPGVGKGTQAKKLYNKFGWAHISTGDMLRDAVRQGSTLGLRAKTYMEKGDLVPDNLIIDLVQERLKDKDCEHGFMLDGFPRTVIQAEKLDELLESLNEKIDDVVSIDVNHEAIIGRLSQRLVCNRCDTVAEPGRGFKVKDACPVCEGELIRRKDDEPETVRKRLEEYDAKTRSLIQYYQGRALLRKIDGMGTLDEVFNRICKQLKLS